MTGPWIRTASGRRWFLLDPDARDLVWWDVAEHLAKVNRFTGATPGCAYSVAQHSCLVADMLPPELQPYGLLHDAHEFCLNDQSSPYKEAMARLGAGDAIKELERRQDQVLYLAAGLLWPPPDRVARAVKQADRIALATEARDLMPPTWSAAGLPAPLSRTIKPWPWPKAAEQFLDRLGRWCPATRRNAAE